MTYELLVPSDFTILGPMFLILFMEPEVISDPICVLPKTIISDNVRESCRFYTVPRTVN